MGLASVNEVRSNVVDAASTTQTIDLTNIEGFSSWGSSYTSHTVNATAFEANDIEVSFSKANRQTSNITDCPVSKGSNNSISIVKGNSYFTSVTFNFKQWTTKNPTITVGYTGIDSEITKSSFTPSITIDIPADKKITSVYFNHSGSNQVGYSSISYTAVQNDSPLTLVELADKYYNDGVYTKVTSINATSQAQNELTELKLFHGSNALDRTTYFNGNALWMTGTNINSGYGTVTNDNLADVQKVNKNATVGDMTHFSMGDDGYPKYDYSVAIANKGGMEEYYRTMSDLAEEADYFNEADWTYVDGSYVHTVELANRATDQYLKDFLAIAAPCLYNSSLENYFLVNKLVVKEENDQLLLQILVDYESHSVKVDNNEGVLAQATISETGNENFYWAGANPKSVNVIASLDDLVSGGTYLIGYDKIAYLGAYYSSNKYYTAVANNIDALQLTFTSTDNGWTISYDYNGTPSYLSLSTDGNKANYSETEYYWNISQNDDGTFAIQPSTYTARYLQYNSNAGQERFACYIGTQNYVSIYELA